MRIASLTPSTVRLCHAQNQLGTFAPSKSPKPGSGRRGVDAEIRSLTCELEDLWSFARDDLTSGEEHSNSESIVRRLRRSDCISIYCIEEWPIQCEQAPQPLPGPPSNNHKTQKPPSSIPRSSSYLYVSH